MRVLSERLTTLEAEGRPIQIALVGCGHIGTAIINQLSQMVGMRVAVIAEPAIERARAALHANGVESVDVVDDADQVAAAMGASVTAITADFESAVAAPVDLVVDATGLPEVGARVALAAFAAGRGLLTMNVELDATVGALLRRKASEAGVVYTLDSGDEPGAAMQLVEFVRSLGFRVVCAGKGHGLSPIIHEATPETLGDEAERLGLSPHIYTTFRDGTKTYMELTCLGNALSMPPDRRGGYAPQVTSDELNGVFRLKSQGGLLSEEGVVDFAVGFVTPEGKPDWRRSVGPGVFVVYTTDHEGIRGDLEYLGQGPGPTYTLYRHYHLPGIETPHAIARAALDGTASLCPAEIPVADAVAVAKRDLEPGEILDGLGGFTVRATVEKASVARAERLVPVALTENARVVHPVSAGTALTMDDLDLDGESLVVQLRQEQDSHLGEGT
jgi:predicted homoserine dehydrogenase-like protein